MKKEKILFVNYDMSIGGNVTSLLSLLSCIDTERYEVDLLLYRNVGDFLTLIPKNINLLPQAFNGNGKIKKMFKALLGNYFFRAYLTNRKLGLKGLSYQVMASYQVEQLSRKLEIEYDYAVGFFEGWSDRYVADVVKATHKYGWFHSMFHEICPNAELELPWMRKMEKIINVSQQAHEHFCEFVPEMSQKAFYYKNINSVSLVRNRAQNKDITDLAYKEFVEAKCFKIITVCRLDVSSKALERAIYASKQLKASGCQFLWYIVGDGKDKEYLQSLIDENDIGDVIRLIGKRTNPYPFVQAADIFCLTSRYEGKPMVITETMMLGTPPVVTAYASAHDQIVHGLDGRIARNDDTSIYDEIFYCYQNSNEVAKMKSYLSTHEYGNEEYINVLHQELFSKH